jgi:ribonuclease T1
VINNPKAARIVAVVVIAMLVITLAASLFGCAAAKPAATSSTDLPKQNRGYYREYTAKTPGESDRGARRIVTGKAGERYYTDDHYKSFRRIAADGGPTDD